MAITELSLPVDIPWKRMGVSGDMIATEFGKLQFPDKWRSSITVFYHEPTDVIPEYCDRKITYLRVVCTITNYQFGENYGDSGIGEDESDVSVLGDLAESYEEFYGWDTFSGNVTQSFPCYGALLQVAVYPFFPDGEAPKEGVPPEQYPYFSAFQPRKREMYEAVSESGEVASQSANRLNVLKGTTGTSTNENYDLDLGGGGWSASGVFGLGSGSSQAGQKQVGTIDRSQIQNQNVTTADASREKRESSAYSTNINQLYTLLQGYHMGTNRAVFFVEPRPHLQDAKFTFIRGLRRLEGIQEFFLIVNRPKWIPGFAVEATLETAHYFTFQDYLPRLIPYADLFTPENLEKTAAALGLDLNDPRFSSYAELLNTWNTSEPFARFIARQYQDQLVTLDQITELVNEGRLDWARISDLVRVTELLPDSGPGDIALIFEEYESDSGPFAGEFFVAGRRLGSAVIPVAKAGDISDCESSQPANISIYAEGASIVHESSHEGLSAALTLSKSDGTASLPLNSLTQRIRDMHHSSLGDPARYPYATVTFFQTEFVLDQMAQLIRLLGKSGIKDVPLGDIEGLQAFVDQGLGKTSNVKTLVDLGTLTTTQVRKDLNLPIVQAKAARRTILILALKNLDPSTLPENYALVNPIQERLSAAFSADRLKELLDSGHPPAKNHGTPAQDEDQERNQPTSA